MCRGSSGCPQAKGTQLGDSFNSVFSRLNVQRRLQRDVQEEKQVDGARSSSHMGRKSWIQEVQKLFEL